MVFAKYSDRVWMCGYQIYGKNNKKFGDNDVTLELFGFFLGGNFVGNFELVTQLL